MAHALGFSPDVLGFLARTGRQPKEALADLRPHLARTLPQAVKFVTQRLAAGAAELRDQIVDAWNSSATWTVGFPLIKVADIESGAVHVTRTSFWSD